MAWRQHVLPAACAAMTVTSATMHAAAPSPAAHPWPPSRLCSQATVVYCRRLGVTARLRALLWIATALYTFGLYSEVRLVC